MHVVQFLSCVWLFATPWTAACQASLSFTISGSLFKLMRKWRNHCLVWQWICLVIVLIRILGYCMVNVAYFLWRGIYNVFRIIFIKKVLALLLGFGPVLYFEVPLKMARNKWSTDHAADAPPAGGCLRLKFSSTFCWKIVYHTWIRLVERSLRSIKIWDWQRKGYNKKHEASIVMSYRKRILYSELVS